MATCPGLNSPTDSSDEAEASTKQHTVPRMLQKGFTLGRNQRTTWLMRPGRKPEIRNHGMNLAQVQAAATQLGEDLHVALAGGGDLFFAGRTLAGIEADNLIA